MSTPLGPAAMPPTQSQYAVSPMQLGILFHSASDTHPGLYVSQVTCPLGPDLDVDLFERAWRAAGQRHPALRSSFEWNGGAEPVQRVHDCELLLNRATAADERLLQETLDRDFNAGFDLGAPPLMRLCLFKVPAGYLFTWTHHHIVLDGRSRTLVLHDVARLYETFRQGRDAQLAEPPAFSDYIDWLGRRMRDDGERSFWREMFDGFIPHQVLPRGRPTPPPVISATQWNTQPVALDGAVAIAVQRRARQMNVTVSILIQAAWALLLSHYRGSSDVAFGVTRACRRSGFPNVTSVVGVLMNTVPLRVRFGPGWRGKDLVAYLREQNVAVRAFEHTPLALVHEWTRASGDAALFDTLIVFEDAPLQHALQSDAHSLWSGGATRRVRTHYPVVLAGYTRPHVRLELNYRLDVVSPQEARELGRDLSALITALAEEPELRCSHLPVVNAGVAVRHRSEPSSPDTVLPAATVPELFEAQVTRTPSNLAVVDGDRTMTYRELNDRANRLAHLLISSGVGFEDIVGIAVPRSMEFLVCLLAVWKAGGAFQPIDCDYPADRLTHALLEARTRHVVTVERWKERLPDGFDNHIVLDVAATAAVLSRLPGSNPSDAQRRQRLMPSHAAYVLYTSGSTGTPKGVLVAHAAIANKIATLSDYLSLSTESRFAAMASVNFDPLLDQLLCPLMKGGATIIVPDTARESPRAFETYAAVHGITVINGTPGLISLLLGETSTRTDTLIIGADVLPRNLANHLRSTRRARRIFNFYGPTETCINAASHEICEVGTGPVPIGSALPSYTLHVLDDYLRPVRGELEGELYIGGVGLARGYVRHPAVTAARFVANPFGVPGSRIYRTGDRVRWRPDGTLDFVGRADDQVKIRGVRIELVEVQRAIELHPAVQRATVIAAEDAAGDRHLVAYCVPRTGHDVSSQALRASVARTLPPHAVPSSFMVLRELPLLPSGKVDRRALPLPDIAAGRAFGRPLSPGTEATVAAIWQEVLGAGRVAADDNFFELGGHSLAAMRVLVRLDSRLGIRLRVEDLLDAPTVAALAARIDARLRA